MNELTYQNESQRSRTSTAGKQLSCPPLVLGGPCTRVNHTASRRRLASRWRCLDYWCGRTRGFAAAARRHHATGSLVSAKPLGEAGLIAGPHTYSATTWRPLSYSTTSPCRIPIRTLESSRALSWSFGARCRRTRSLIRPDAKFISR